MILSDCVGITGPRSRRAICTFGQAEVRAREGTYGLHHCYRVSFF